MSQIYLDYCSTTPLDPRVAEVIQECWRRGLVNPASQHRMGQAARRELERLKTGILQLLGAQTAGMKQDRLIVTSGGTESNHLAILGLVRPDRPCVVVSAIEHPSVMGAAEILQRRGVAVKRLPVNSSGVACIEELPELLQGSPTSLVSLMLVNNETGVIQPVAEAAKICRKHGALLHTDAVQAVGHLPISFGELQVDAMTIAPHKFYGPRGVGALLIRHAIEPTPMMIGGTQQLGSRPGTEDVALVAGMHAAVDLAVKHRVENEPSVTERRNRFEAELLAKTCGPLVLIGCEAARSGHVSNVSFPGLDRQAVFLAADFNGLAISTGSACASGSSEPSPVLAAMGLGGSVIEGAIRVSFGVPTTDSETSIAVDRLAGVVNGLRGV